jgi:hypothetical protein
VGGGREMGAGDVDVGHSDSYVHTYIQNTYTQYVRTYVHTYIHIYIRIDKSMCSALAKVGSVYWQM